MRQYQKLLLGSISLSCQLFFSPFTSLSSEHLPTVPEQDKAGNVPCQGTLRLLESDQQCTDSTSQSEHPTVQKSRPRGQQEARICPCNLFPFRQTNRQTWPSPLHPSLQFILIFIICPASLLLLHSYTSRCLCYNPSSLRGHQQFSVFPKQLRLCSQAHSPGSQPQGTLLLIVTRGGTEGDGETFSPCSISVLALGPYKS